jgi:hypothetical protein
MSRMSASAALAEVGDDGLGVVGSTFVPRFD